jgi:hypothetical protein
LSLSRCKRGVDQIQWTGVRACAKRLVRLYVVALCCLLLVRIGRLRCRVPVDFSDR